MESSDTLTFKIVMPVILVTGVYTNTMNLIIIYRLRTRFHAFVFYFIGESVSDMCIVIVMMPRWFESLVHLRLEFPVEGHWLCKTETYILYVSLTVCAWIQAVMSVQRMSGTMWPHIVRGAHAVRIAKVSVFSVVLFAMTLHLVVLLGDTFDWSSCYLGSYKQPANSVAGTIHTCLHLTLGCIAPVMVIIASNVGLLTSFTRSAKACAFSGRVPSARSVLLHRSQVHTITKVVMGTALAHVLMLTPMAVAETLVVTGVIHEKNISANGWAVLVILYVSKSSVPFFIYRLSGRPFRRDSDKSTTVCLVKPSVLQDRPIAHDSTNTKSTQFAVPSPSVIATRLSVAGRVHVGMDESEI